MDSVALACRYGRAGLSDALAAPLRLLFLFNESVRKLIQAENKQPSLERDLMNHNIEGGG